MRHHRTARALAAAAVAGALALLAAPAHAADTAPPGCASAVVEVGWVTSHHDGRYQLDRVLLDGLEECAGAELVLALGAVPGSHEVTAVVPASGALDLDVAGLAVPAAHLDRVAVLVDGRDLTPTTPITPTPPHPRQNRQDRLSPPTPTPTPGSERSSSGSRARSRGPAPAAASVMRGR